METLNYSLRQDLNTKENYYTLFKPKNVLATKQIIDSHH